MTNKELQALTEALSDSFFDRPFQHKAIFNPRLRTTGGRYLLSSHNIELNEKHYAKYGKEELVGIIKHELCHYHLHLLGKGYRHKDQDFKQLLKKLVLPVTVALLKNVKHRYITCINAHRASKNTTVNGKSINSIMYVVYVEGNFNFCLKKVLRLIGGL